MSENIHTTENEQEDTTFGSDAARRLGKGWSTKAKVGAALGIGLVAGGGASAVGFDYIAPESTHVTTVSGTIEQGGGVQQAVNDALDSKDFAKLNIGEPSSTEISNLVTDASKAYQNENGEVYAGQTVTIDIDKSPILRRTEFSIDSNAKSDEGGQLGAVNLPTPQTPEANPTPTLDAPIQGNPDSK